MKSVMRPLLIAFKRQYFIDQVDILLIRFMMSIPRATMQVLLETQ